jgi:TPP-dependent pyruvate/acetoin dehydrogenase alpha subunit
MGDFTYRTREEVESWKARDPLVRFRAHLLSQRLADETQLAELERQAADEAADARRFAEASPWPDPATAATNVYATP